MNDLGSLGRGLIFAGAALLIIGVVLVLGPRIPYLGRLPGDIQWRRGGTTVYVPIVTSILLSVLLTIILNVIFRR